MVSNNCIIAFFLALILVLGGVVGSVLTFSAEVLTTGVIAPAVFVTLVWVTFLGLPFGLTPLVTTVGEISPVVIVAVLLVVGITAVVAGFCGLVIIVGAMDFGFL